VITELHVVPDVSSIVELVVVEVVGLLVIEVRVSEGVKVKPKLLMLPLPLGNNMGAESRIRLISKTKGMARRNNLFKQITYQANILYYILLHLIFKNIYKNYKKLT